MSLRLLGVGYFCIVSIWFFVGKTPCCVTCRPNMFTSVLPTSSFFGLNMIPDCPQNVRYFAHCIKLCLNDVAHSKVSSIHLFQLGFVHCFFVSLRQRNTEFGSVFSALIEFFWVIFCFSPDCSRMYCNHYRSIGDRLSYLPSMMISMPVSS